MPERLTEEEIAEAIRDAETLSEIWSDPQRLSDDGDIYEDTREWMPSIAFALRQLRGDLEVKQADLQTVTIMCGEAIRERDAARAQVQALREALHAEHQPHAEWVGCPTCAALANLPAAVQAHMARDRAADRMAEYLEHFGSDAGVAIAAAYRAAGGEG